MKKREKREEEGGEREAKKFSKRTETERKEERNK